MRKALLILVCFFLAASSVNAQRKRARAKPPRNALDQLEYYLLGRYRLLDGKGSQRGYFNNVHPDGGRDWGTFEGQVTTAGGAMTVEGTYKFAGGDGQYRGLTGGGKFKTVMKSEIEIGCSWEGTSELAKTQTG